jgi:diacylglycerol kinase (ATP)
MPRKYIKKRFNSFGYALKGIISAFRSEPNMLLHVLGAAGAFSLGIYFKLSSGEWCWIVLAIGLVWMAEIFNTALEKLTDLVSPSFHELAGQAKDLAAGAVLMAALTALAIGILIFWPYLAALPYTVELLKKYF